MIQVNFGSLNAGATFKVLNETLGAFNGTDTFHPETPLMTKISPITVTPTGRGLNNPSGLSQTHNVSYQAKSGNTVTAFLDDSLMVVECS